MKVIVYTNTKCFETTIYNDTIMIDGKHINYKKNKDIQKITTIDKICIYEKYTYRILPYLIVMGIIILISLILLFVRRK